MKKKITLLKNKANSIRKLIIKMLAEAKSGHPGGYLSSTEIITCLYFEVMRHDSKKPEWAQSDRFQLSKGHCCPVVYSGLALSGYFPIDELMKLRKLGCLLQGHPDRSIPGIEVASGSLGQGLSVASGISLAGKIDKQDYRVYCLMGDGELQEGNIWEAAMSSAHFKLDNLCGIVDYNHFQIDGRIEEIMDLAPLADKWISFGWHVIQCDGHSFDELLKDVKVAKTMQQTHTVIIANTVKGKGVSFMEHVVDFHGRAPTKEEKAIALSELEKNDSK